MAKRRIKNEEIETNATRHYLRVVAFVAFGISLVALLMLHVYPRLTQRPLKSTEEVVIESNEQEETQILSLSRSGPVSLRIPTIAVDTTFESPLGLHADQTIEVPDSYDKVGWYGLGVSPGEVGPAVILGHVDSYNGPAVFYSLGQLTPGDQIYIERADGTETTFEVMYLERYSQDEFPTEKVYGSTETPELRLITCTGIYDRGAKRYSHNLVVYARLVNENSVR